MASLKCCLVGLALCGAACGGEEFASTGSGSSSGGGATAGPGGGGTGGDATSVSASAGGATGSGGAGASSSAGPGGSAGCSADEVCVPPLPDSDGWKGPVAMYAGTDFPACAGEKQLLHQHGPQASGVPPLGCSACDCGVPQGSGCASPKVTYYSDNACNVALGTQTLAGEDVCLDASVLTFGAAKVTQWGPAMGGTCFTLGGSIVSVPAIDWKLDAMLCEGPPAGPMCSGGSCLPKPPPEFEDTYCIYRNGPAQCPPEFPTDVTLLEDSFVDERKCGDCMCGSPQGVTCSGYALLAASDDCSGGNQSVSAACSPFGAADPVNPPTVTWTATTMGGSCAPSGGQPSGTVVPDKPVQVCCL